MVTYRRRQPTLGQHSRALIHLQSWAKSLSFWKHLLVSFAMSIADLFSKAHVGGQQGRHIGKELVVIIQVNPGRFWVQWCWWDWEPSWWLEPFFHQVEPLCIHSVSQIFHLFLHESILVSFQPQSCFFQPEQNLVQILEMIRFIHSRHQNIIQVQSPEVSLLERFPWSSGI